MPTDQVNLTDEESRIMPVAGGGFEQCYNAQAVVAEGSLLVVATDVVQAANDKQQLQRMLNQVIALPDTLGKAETLLADNGYFSAANVAACEAAAVQPLIAMGREAHHPSLSERFADAPPRRRTPRRSRRWPIGWRRWKARALSPAQTDAGAGVRHHQVVLGFVSFCCVGSTRCAASGAL